VGAEAVNGVGRVDGQGGPNHRIRRNAQSTTHHEISDTRVAPTDYCLIDNDMVANVRSGTADTKQAGGPPPGGLP
jgi:hypothetical protein